MKTISARQIENPKEKEVWKNLQQTLFPASIQMIEEDERAEAFRRARQAVAAIQRESIRKGLNKMTLEEINAEIAASRRERLQRQSR